jgi:CheY-like chemotaxis protein
VCRTKEHQVSRILVADDNSNIQKMVALALKDEGIDVVAVGNGDAAMRKIPDLHPDLVLADIFMPVRNGYEVCEFVKSDSRYMNTPVVLLVGAFDPLDEEETQRVHADGVLKKPFVPPDPLINMVKALLAKSNGQKPAANTTASSQISARIQAAPEAAESAKQPAPAANVAPPAQRTPEQPTKTGPVTPQSVPLALPSQNAAPEVLAADETDEVVTAVRDPNLGEPFWATPEELEEDTEEQKATDAEEMVDMHSFGKGDGERTTSRFRPDLAMFEKTQIDEKLKSRKPPVNVAAPPEPVTQTLGAELPSDSIQVSPEPLELESPAEAVPASDEMPLDHFKFDPTLTLAVPDTNPEPAEELPAMPPPEFSSTHTDQQPGPNEPSPTLELEPLESTAAEESAISWPAISDTVAEEPAASLVSVETDAAVQPAELDLASIPNQEAVITAATEAARAAFSQIQSGLSDQNAERGGPANGQPSAAPSNLAVTEAPAPSPEVIEAVVNRLLERMQPQIMEVVNREVLRPAIEAIVRREMDKS